MKHLLLLSLLLVAGCHSADPPAALKQAVATYLRPRVAGYQPLGWGRVRTWRQVDADSLVVLRHRDREDSLRVWWRRFYEEHKATLSEHYADSVNHLQDSLTVYGITLNNLAAKYDTTRLGTQLGHTYQRRTAGGQFVRDSAQFLIPRHGPVVQLPKLKPLY